MLANRGQAAFHHNHVFKSNRFTGIPLTPIQSTGRNKKYRYHSRFQKLCTSYSSINKSQPISETETEANMTNLDGIERVFAISDLHTDNIANMEWLKERCIQNEHAPSELFSEPSYEHLCVPGPNDALIIAGDISHKLSVLSETLSIIRENLQCHIFFVWGNHEAWVGGDECDALGLKTSLEKIDAVKNLCHRLGVNVEHRLVGAANTFPVWIAPIEGWYDATLTLDGCEDLCANFASWPWVDFVRCVWPSSDILDRYQDSTLSKFDDSVEVSRIPLGLSQLLSQRNMVAIREMHDRYSSVKVASTTTNTINKPGLITFSHFLTNHMSLPDWKDPSSKVFMREWLDHPAPQVSAKFAKVAGSLIIDKQIRSIIPSQNSSSPSKQLGESSIIHHLHVFGHSHRPKDFVTDGVRYIHNPLGKPNERNLDLVSKDVGFQLIWDCTRSSSMSNDINISHTTTLSIPGGEVPGKRIIRFWEEKEGGIFKARKEAHQASL